VFLRALRICLCGKIHAVGNIPASHDVFVTSVNAATTVFELSLISSEVIPANPAALFGLSLSIAIAISCRRSCHERSRAAPELVESGLTPLTSTCSKLSGSSGSHSR
jgi:hypothetical protein